MDYPKNFEVELGQSISNAFSHVSEAFSTQERLQAALQPAFEVDKRLQAALQPAFEVDKRLQAAPTACF